MTSGTNYRWVTALIAALVGGLLAAVITPRFSEEESVSWLVVGVVAVVAGLAVLLATREKVDEGTHVRDDALPPS